MSVGRILTLGLGNPFAGRKYLPTLGFGTSGVAPVVTTTTTATPGGVKKKPVVIRLSDIKNMPERESLADFIKSHLDQPSVTESVEESEQKKVFKAGKRSKKQREADRLAEIAMRNMQIEAENESRQEYNRKIMLLLLMAALDE